MNNDEEKLYKQLLDKSQEAFIMSIEIYNKPTIKYRVESFSFLICNAWELMLKAKIIKDEGEQAIYFKDNLERTKSLSWCVKHVFTNDMTPLRKNLEEIIELRDLSTHFITQEYELIYVPLFQSCVNNYTNKMIDFHSIDITKVIPTHFLNLYVGDSLLSMREIESKYSKIVVDNLLRHQSKIQNMAEENHNDKFAIVIRQDMRLVKNKDSSVQAFRYVKNGEEPEGSVMVIKHLQDPNQTHPYSMMNILKNVKSRIAKQGIDLAVNKSHIQEFISFYDLKHDEKYCYTHRNYNTPSYSYSPDLVDFIVCEIQKDIDCFEKIHNQTLKRKKKN